MIFFPSSFMTNDTACREHPLEEDRLLTTNAAALPLAPSRHILSTNNAFHAHEYVLSVF